LNKANKREIKILIFLVKWCFILVAIYKRIAEPASYLTRFVPNLKAFCAFLMGLYKGLEHAVTLFGRQSA